MDQYHLYQRNGKEIFDKYCSSTENRPVMLPRAPSQMYIDVYPEGPGPSFANDIQQQLNYEAEVTVYRCLQDSDENIIVLHSFQYTHHQYRLCDKNHVRKGCRKCKNASNVEGECDFLVIGETFFVLIEVKNIKNNLPEGKKDKVEQSRILSGTFNKSVQQRKKTAQLIRAIGKRSKVLQFTAYPEFSKEFHEEFQLNPNEIDTIIFKDDLNNFGNWWDKNVKDFVLDEHNMSAGFRPEHEKIRNMLLAIWCTEKDDCDQSKCSLGRCILDIDEKLRSGKFVYRSENPNVVSAPDNIIRECLGVDNLTKQQHDLYTSEEKFVLIDGPAGAGKSVVLIAKAIQLAKSSENNKVIMFSFIQRLWLPTIYEKAFGKAQIRCHTINCFEISELFEFISSVDSEVKVILVQGMHYNMILETKLQSIINIISNLEEEYNVFIDDFQCMYNGFITSLKSEENMYFAIVSDLFDLSECCKYLWLAVDFLQSLPFMDGEKYDMCEIRWLVESVLCEQYGCSIYHFPSNLRNTYDLSNVLSILRNNSCTEGLPWPPGMNIPAQVKGHYIHGPRTSFFVFRNLNIESIISCLYKELRKVSHDGIMNLAHPDVCAILNVPQFMWNSDTLDLPDDTLDIQEHASRYFRTFGRVFEMLNVNCKCMCLQRLAYSAEWPAVIVLHEMSDKINPMDIASLNLSMSRARVYCSVILFPKDGEQLNDYYLDQFLDKLKGHASITECS